MIQFIPVVMVCHLSMAPHDCNDQTSVTRTYGYPQNNPMTCMIESQLMVSRLATTPRPEEPYYVKFGCKKTGE